MGWEAMDTGTCLAQLSWYAAPAPVTGVKGAHLSFGLLGEPDVGFTVFFFVVLAGVWYCQMSLQRCRATGGSGAARCVAGLDDKIG